MINKIRENSKRFERMTEDQLHTTTLTTIQMHQSFVDELEDQSRKTEKLLGKNKQLQAEHKVRLFASCLCVPLAIVQLNWFSVPPTCAGADASTRHS